MTAITSSTALLKQLGFESRTLLNAITGPVQLIRSISNDPNLMETLHILEMGTVRFEKFSLRAQLLADLLNPEIQLPREEFDLVDILRHVILELNDLLHFYGVKVKVDAEIPSIMLKANRDAAYQAFSGLIEQGVALLGNGEEITVTAEQKRPEKIVLEFSCNDSGFLARKFNESAEARELDIMLFVSVLKEYGIEFRVVENEGRTRISIRI